MSVVLGVSIAAAVLSAADLFRLGAWTGQHHRSRAVARWLAVRGIGGLAALSAVVVGAALKIDTV